MKLVYSTHYLYPLRGGASRSTHALLTELAQEHEVHAIYPGMQDSDGERGGIHIHERRNMLRVPPFYFSQFRTWRENNNWLKILDRFVAQSKPDTVLTSMDYAPSSIEVAKLHDIPSVLFIHDYKHFCPISFVNGIECNRRCWFCAPEVNSTLYNALKHVQDILQYPFTRKMLDWHERTVRGVNTVAANSQYVADLTKRWFNIEAKVIYPFIALSSVEPAADRGYITFVNPLPHKGVKIFIEIAERLKDRAFLCVGRMPSLFELRKRFLGLPNLKYIEWKPDMNRIYSKTRILLVPSIWPEAFGMVAVEAMANGIPCIVSSRGALPEVVGDAGIIVDDLFDPNAWAEAIRRLDDESEYKERAERGKEQVEKFDPKQQYEKFKGILQAIT